MTAQKKRMFVVHFLMFFTACSTVEEEALDLSSKSSHTIYPSLYLTDRNATEEWLEGKWKLVEGIAFRLGSPYTEFSYDSVKGKWMKTITIGTNTKSGEYTIIEEGSFWITENYWGNNAHFIRGQVLGAQTSGNMLYEEIEKLSEDRFCVYNRGFNLSTLPSGFDPDSPDPALAERNFGGQMYAVFERVK